MRFFLFKADTLYMSDDEEKELRKAYMLPIVSRIDAQISLKDINRPILCEEIGIDKSSFSFWANGTIPSIDKIFRIADFFGISAKWLVTGEKDIALNDKQRIFLEKYEKISESSLLIALAADKLNEAGKKAALSMVEGLEKDFPLARTSSVDVG
jgi:transcriptional regulator with XRE-family HTH domain